jgi:hypothetical protein
VLIWRKASQWNFTYPLPVATYFTVYFKQSIIVHYQHEISKYFHFKQTLFRLRSSAVLYHTVSYPKFRGGGGGSDWVHLVQRSQLALLHQPRTPVDYGAFGGMRIGRGNRSTRRKPASVPLCPPQIPHDLTLYRTRAAEAGIRVWYQAAATPSALESEASAGNDL